MGILRFILTLVRRTVHEFGDDRCSHMAAAISYYVLFSMFPLVTFLVSTLSLFLDADTVKEKVVDGVMEVVPLTEDQGADLLVGIVDDVLAARGPISIISLLLTAWAARTMFSALRVSLNVAWDIAKPRPLAQQLLMDLAMVTGVGLLFLTSLGSTMFLQVARRLTEDLGPLSAASGFLWETAFYLLPALLSFLTFAIVYHWVPNVPVRWSEAVLGAVVATVLFEAAKNAFALYLRNFANYDATYGTLGGIAAFLFWTYISAAIVLLGAEVASEYPRVRRGDYAAAAAPAARRPWRQVALDTIKGLVVHRAPRQGEDKEVISPPEREKPPPG